jgi:hypothetical protein
MKIYESGYGRFVSLNRIGGFKKSKEKIRGGTV